MSDNQRLTALVLRWQELRAQGREISLAELCQDCPEQAGEVARRLDALRAVNRPPDNTACTAPIRPAAEFVAPIRPEGHAPLPDVPGYDLLEELGRGGMGVVYKARQASLDRLVALKMVLPGSHASPEELARFRREAEAVARLQHPNIVHIHEVGQAHGIPFFSLEYVAGGSLDRRVKGTPLPARQAAALVQAVARAMHSAHERGMVHRDLKPANILLAPSNRPEGLFVGADASQRFEPKVADFGLAKRFEGEPGALSTGVQTQSGAVMGTPSYMAPEQAGGRKEVGPLADVYALGAILYELLTGRPPFKAETPMETLLQVLREEPVPPSRLQPKIARDLETVCLKSLEKMPKKRYASAAALAEDLARFVKGQPVLARPVGRPEKLWRWCRRNPAMATAAVLVVVALAAGTLVSTTFAVRATQAQKRTENALTNVQVERDHVARRLAANYLERGLALCSKENDPAAGLLWMCRALEELPRDAADLEETIRTNLSAWGSLVHALKATLVGPGNVHAIALSPDGQTLLIGGAVSGQKSGEARLWSVNTGRPVGPSLKHPGVVIAVAFSPDGKTLLTGSDDHMARLWSAATGKSLAPPLKHHDTVNAVNFSPDGKTALTGCYDETARLWSPATGQPVGPPFPQDSRAAFSPDGQTLFTGFRDSTRLWSVATGQPLGPLLKHRGRINAFSPDGKIVLIGGKDNTAWLSSMSTGKPVGPPLQHKAPVHWAAFRPDGLAVWTASYRSRDKEKATMQLWATAGQALGPAIDDIWDVVRITFSRDGQIVLTTDEKKARLWSGDTGEPVGPPLRHEKGVDSAVLTPDGRTLVTGSSEEGAVRVWSAAPSQPIGLPLAHKNVNDLVFSADGKTVLTGSDDGHAQRWSVASGQPLGIPLVKGSGIGILGFSSDGTTVVTLSADGTTRAWLASTGKPLGPLVKLQARDLAVKLSPDAKTLVTRDIQTGTLRLWSMETGEAVGPPLRASCN
jgi:WD40 repeat protein/serine/threonine protein kinase